MKNFFKKISWEQFETILSATIARFPLTTVALFLAGIVLIYQINAGDLFNDVWSTKIIFGALLLVWTSVSVQLLSESFGLIHKHRALLLAATMVMAIGYGSSFPVDFANLPGQIGMTHLFLHIALAISMTFSFVLKQVINRTYSNDTFYNFSITTGLYMAQSVIIVGTLFVLGASVLGSVDLLFDVSWITGENYAEWFVISAVIIAPLYFLSLIPNTLPTQLAVGEKFMHFLVRYMGIPFIVIYFVILYAYTIKVLMNFSQWPQGEVAWLVIWFSFFSYLVYALSHTLSNESWVQKIRLSIPLLLLPQIAMLFYAIGLRVNQYGFTINRYLVVVFGLWLVILSIYFVIRRRNAQLVVIPMTLFISIGIIMVGPWGMFAVSERSQLYELEQQLVSIDMLQPNGNIRGLASAELEALSNSQIDSINSIIRYLCQYHGCSSMRSLLPNQVGAITSRASAWEASDTIISELNLPLYTSVTPGSEQYLSAYSFNYLQSIDVSNYNYLSQFESQQDELFSQQTQSWYNTVSGNLHIVTMGQEDRVIYVQDKLVDALVEYGSTGDYARPITKETSPMIPVAVVHNEHGYMLYISNIGGRRIDGTITIEHVSGVVLY